jgi:NADPH-dependent 7-cyano-7-deazaguanine reductase QueF
MSLQVKPNPLKGKNALLCFKHKNLLGFTNAEIHFSYIPDRDIVEQNIFKNFIQKLEQEKPTLEEFSNRLVENFYHEVLPFYTRLDITIHDKETGEVQRIQTVEKQPKYIIPEEIRNLF